MTLPGIHLDKAILAAIESVPYIQPFEREMDSTVLSVVKNLAMSHLGLIEYVEELESELAVLRAAKTIEIVGQSANDD